MKRSVPNRYVDVQIEFTTRARVWTLNTTSCPVAVIHTYLRFPTFFCWPATSSALLSPHTLLFTPHPSLSFPPPPSPPTPAEAFIRIRLKLRIYNPYWLNTRSPNSDNKKHTIGLDSYTKSHSLYTPPEKPIALSTTSSSTSSALRH